MYNGRMMTDQHGRLSPCVCNTLRMVTRVVTQLYDDCLRPSGLRVTQFSILSAIARLGEASLKRPEDELAIDQTTLTRGLRCRCCRRSRAQSCRRAYPCVRVPLVVIGGSSRWRKRHRDNTADSFRTHDGRQPWPIAVPPAIINRSY